MGIAREDQARILLVEDDENMRASCLQALKKHTHMVYGVSSPREAEPILVREELDLVITDLRMPEGGGMEVLRVAREVSPDLPVILITAYPSVESAVDAFKSGVVDYLLKPFTSEQLIEAVEAGLLGGRAKDRAEFLRGMGTADAGFPEMVGNSPQFCSFLAELRRIATHEGHVMISGETGSGKELAAKAIHKLSKRSFGSYVVLNCAALPDPLLEAEMFGYEKGAFTGAMETKPGLLEQTHRGSLLLDEVAELSPAAQAKLLRCLEEKSCRRIGGIEMLPADVRILAATHKDLETEVREGRFREDIFYRLSAIEIRVPPLRERPEDIAQLAISFLDKFCADEGRAILGFTEDALDMLAAYPWPGNVRELQNVILKAFIRSRSPLITPKDIRDSGALKSMDEIDHESQTPRHAAVSDFEKQHLTEALRQHDGNVTHTAKTLGIHRTTLQRLMKKLGLRSSS